VKEQKSTKSLWRKVNDIDEIRVAVDVSWKTVLRRTEFEALVAMHILLRKIRLWWVQC